MCLIKGTLHVKYKAQLQKEHSKSLVVLGT